MHSKAAYLGRLHSHLSAACACRLANCTVELHSWTMPRSRGVGMPRAKKKKVQAAAAVETDELIEPAPPQPFRFEPERPQEPIAAQRKVRRAEEHQMDLKVECIAACMMWKTARKDASMKLRRWLAAQACKSAKYDLWDRSK